MVVKIREIVAQNPKNAPDKLLILIRDLLKSGKKISISFEGVGGITSSFVNSAFVPLLEDCPLSELKEKIVFVNTIKQQNEILKKRLEFEDKRIRKPL